MPDLTKEEILELCEAIKVYRTFNIPAISPTQQTFSKILDKLHKQMSSKQLASTHT